MKLFYRLIDSLSMRVVNGLFMCGMLTLIISCESLNIDDLASCDTNGLAIEVVQVDGTSCGESGGRVTLSASGGNGGYMFSMDGSTPQTSAVFAGLSAGEYSFTVTDALGCEVMIDATVLNIDGINLTFDITESGCLTSDGTIMVNATGQTGNVQFKLNNGSFQSGSLFEDLTTGEYQVTALDDSGCEIITDVRVHSGISYSTSVLPIIQANCAVSSCHDGGNSLPNWNVFANVRNNAGNIRSRTQNGSMPPIGSLTAEEITMIACWVDDGALNN